MTICEKIKLMRTLLPKLCNLHGNFFFIPFEKPFFSRRPHMVISYYFPWFILFFLYPRNHYRKICRCRAPTHGIECNAVKRATERTAKKWHTTYRRDTRQKKGARKRKPHGKLREKPTTKAGSRQKPVNTHGKGFLMVNWRAGSTSMARLTVHPNGQGLPCALLSRTANILKSKNLLCR
jgi:hypothetical protein